MTPHKLVRGTYGVKLSVSIKYQNLHSFKEGMILVCYSILETTRISRLQESLLFTIPLKKDKNLKKFFERLPTMGGQ